jgi:aspartate/methionine/tyrosine aminotransferase
VVAVNSLAIELNEVLRENAPSLYTSLSALGRELYYPRGILTQTAEAKKKAYLYDATIGIATSGGLPLHLPSLHRLIPGLEPGEAFPYAPTTGLPELRALWGERQREANPGLGGKGTSLPVVTSGVTHGLSICADLFCDAGDTLLLPDMIWGNYRMIFETRRGADIRQFRLFDDGGGMDTGALRETLFSCLDRSKVLLLLNFPNNPTGYSPTREEASAIATALVEAAEAGANVVAITDDAYFGLFYEDGVSEESLFSLIAGAHPRLTAVKLDGATKEDYVWGFRLGFITFSCSTPGDAAPVYDALEKKTGGLIRGTISNCSILAQSLLVKAMASSSYGDEKREAYRLLKERYDTLKEALSDARYSTAFEPYPFNSGYFMCVRVKGVNAEDVRRRLLDEKGVGLISLGESDLRIAFSCMEREQVKDLFDILYTTVDDLQRNA